MRRILIASITLAVCFLTIGNAVAAEEAAAWKAGVAKACITPREPYFVAGYGGEKRIATEKLHDLWIKVLALEDAQGRRGVLISCDICGFDRVGYEAVCAGLKDRCGLQPSQIILNFTHNHSGPVTRNSLMPFHNFTTDDLRRIDAYSRNIEQKAVAAAAEAFGRLQPATLSFGTGKADFAVNRRTNDGNNGAAIQKILAEGGKLNGPVDHDLPVISVRSNSGDLIAVVFAYSCHPVTYVEPVWSGDFPGFAMLDLENKHPGAMALFCQACGGDQNSIRGSIELTRDQGHRLAAAVEATLDKPMSKIEPRLATAEACITLDYERVVDRKELEAVLQTEDPAKSTKARWARQALAELNAKGQLPGGYPYPIQAWKLGGELLWIGLGGEPVVDYALLLKEKYGPNTLVTGYCSDLMAYIPSRRVWEEGHGEEVEYLWEYGRPAHRWAGDCQRRIFSAVEQTIQKLQ
jgi:neutral ceramidase